MGKVRPDGSVEPDADGVIRTDDMEIHPYADGSGGVAYQKNADGKVTTIHYVSGKKSEDAGDEEPMSIDLSQVPNARTHRTPPPSGGRRRITLRGKK